MKDLHLAFARTGRFLATDGHAHWLNLALFLALFWFRPEGWQEGALWLAGALGLTFLAVRPRYSEGEAVRLGPWRLNNFNGLLLAGVLAYKAAYPCNPFSESCPLTTWEELVYVWTFSVAQVLSVRVRKA